MYYLYQYSARKASDSSADSSGSFFRFGVALVRTNLENADTDLLYDFKDVYPHHNERATPHVLQPIDENTFAFIYNGKVSVFDVKTEEITQTVDFYDKEAFVAEDNGVKIKNNKYSDFYYLSGGVLCYAEYRPESREYVRHCLHVIFRPSSGERSEEAAASPKAGSIDASIDDFKRPAASGKTRRAFGGKHRFNGRRSQNPARRVAFTDGERLPPFFDNW